MADHAAIKIMGLTKIFRNNKVIDEVNLKVNKGELFSLVGPNGAGKTTLIKILCNLILPTSGDVFINGYNMSDDSEKVRASIGLVTGDERSFYWRLTGRQNIEFFATLYNLTSSFKRNRIRELFGLLEIEEPDKRFQEYPSGIKERLSIVRALLNDIDILFTDDITKNLDLDSARGLRKFIKETLVKKHGKTVFFSTHQLYEIGEIADRVAFMSKGRILVEGTIDTLREIMNNKDADIEGIYDYFITGRG